MLAALALLGGLQAGFGDGWRVEARPFTDAAGRTVEVPEHPTRILAAGPPASVLLYTLAPDRMVGWTLIFLKPILSALGGGGFEALASEPAILAHPMAGGGFRNTFLRGRLERRSDGRRAFAAHTIQDNAIISGLAKANALVLRPAGATALAVESSVEMIRFDLIPGF